MANASCLKAEDGEEKRAHTEGGHDTKVDPHIFQAPRVKVVDKHVTAVHAWRRHLNRNDQTLQTGIIRHYTAETY